ncbi:hypothetical protein V496_06120 [Pseudogymnoascus sp. VKM F-4515 (FW-2607)]|nr:hypothetical protein V496_06120 [Pseudogymnoascus sp. VKM F-4515 (FW-2607)]
MSSASGPRLAQALVGSMDTTRLEVAAEDKISSYTIYYEHRKEAIGIHYRRTIDTTRVRQLGNSKLLTLKPKTLKQITVTNLSDDSSGSRCRDRRDQDAAFERPEVDFGNRPTVSRFHKVAIVIAGTGCGLSKGPGHIWESD